MINSNVENKPAVVCLHSLFLSPDTFTDLKERGGDEFNFITPTFLGQVDRIDEVSTTVTMDDCANDVISMLDRLGVDRFSIVGQSMGADVGVRLAARYPERIDRIVFMGASVCAEPAEQRASFDGLSVMMENEGFNPQLVEIVMGVLFSASTLSDPEKADMLNGIREHLARIPTNFIHAARGVVERESAVDLLSLVSAPTLVISGVEDLVRPPSWSDEIFDGIKDCQLWRLKRVGHSPILENPSLVIPRTLEFLRAL